MEDEAVVQATIPVGMMDILSLHQQLISSTLSSHGYYDDAERFTTILHKYKGINKDLYFPNSHGVRKLFFVVAVATRNFNDLAIAEYINRAIANYNQVEKAVAQEHFPHDFDLDQTTFMTEFIPRLSDDPEALRDVVLSISQLDKFYQEFVNRVNNKFGY